MLKTMTFRTTLIAFACAVSFSAHAMADEPRKVDVPAGELTVALQKLAEQSGVEFVYSADQLKGVRTKGVRGEFTAEKAVTMLLEGTKLKLTMHESGALLIAPPAVAMSSSSSTTRNSGVAVGVGPLSGGSEEEREEKHSWRLARADASSAERADQETSSSSTGSQKRIELEEVIVKMPEILIKGNRSLNTDIVRTEDDVQPYVILSREEIERATATNVEDFLKTHLPMNTLQETNSQRVFALMGGNQSTIDLRGLGANQTLILVNGRRLPSVSSVVQNNSFQQPDINGLPLASIERIEVLPSTAGGIFGGGATGGVVNIILRRDYAGLELRATYGNVFDADAASRRVDASGGVSLEGGRTHLLFTASYSDQEPLQVGDRDFVAQGRALGLANSPASFFETGTPPLGRTSNVRNATAGNLVLDDGTALPSNITSVPEGYAGVATDGGAALAQNAGRYSLDLPDTIAGARESLINGPTVRSVSANLRRDFGAGIEAFVDLAEYRNRGSAYTAFVPSAVTLPADALNNPFTTAIRVRFPFTNLAFETVSETQTVQAIGGVIVRLPKDWTGEVDYNWSRSRLEFSGTDPSLRTAEVSAALASGTLDVVRDLNEFPLDYSPFALPSPNGFVGPSDVRLKDATLRVAGPTLSLPGGRLTLSGLLERREQEARGTYRQGLNNTAGVTFGEPFTLYFPPRFETVHSGYLEASVPLVGPANARPGLEALEIQASIRRDEYTTKSVRGGGLAVASRDAPLPELPPYSTNTVTSNGKTIGLRYAPLPDVALRASYGSGFLPPAIGDIVPSVFQNVDYSFYSDPQRGDTPLGVSLSVTQDGNPNLLPEKSESRSLGAIFTPRFWPGFRLAIDYTKIEKTNEISSADVGYFLLHEESFPGRVTRAPLTAEDAAFGYTAGEVIAVDESLVNIARADVDTYDLQADYAWHSTWGAFRLYALATWLPEFERQYLPELDPIHYVGFRSGFLEWRGNAGLTWDHGAWTVGWSAQYFGSYSLVGVGSTSQFPSLAQQGADYVPSQIYHDLSVRYRFGSSPRFAQALLSHAEIMLGIQNVLDENPPILATTGTTGGYSTYGDPRLRRYSLSLRKSFQ